MVSMLLRPVALIGLFAALVSAAVSIGVSLALFTATASVPSNTFTTTASFPMPTPTPTPTGPANDDFDNAIVVPEPLPYTNNQSTVDATAELGEPLLTTDCGIYEDDMDTTVWYKYTPTVSQPLAADTLGSSHDTRLAVHTGATVDTLTLIGCNDDAPGSTQSEVTFAANAGTSYYFQVDGYDGATGDLVFNLQAGFTQYATSATASSEYGPTDWGAVQATGAPDLWPNDCGDYNWAWEPETGGSAAEWLEVSYDTAVYATGLAVYETYNTGFIYQVDLIDTDGVYHTVWTGTDNTGCPGEFTLTFPRTDYVVDGIKIYTQKAGYEAIDAVKLVGQVAEQYATSATASSEYSPTDWGAVQATGAPDLWPDDCGDYSWAWTPETDGSAAEWLEVSYDIPVYATGLTVYETYNTGFIYQVDLIDTGDGYHTIWTGTDSTGCPGKFILTFAETAYLVDGIKIYTQKPDYEAIDAVKLVGQQ
jgi:metal-sulfur cluster biosynthetic enzyme